MKADYKNVKIHINKILFKDQKEMFDLIMDLKLGKYSLEEVRKIADENIFRLRCI